MPGHTQPLPASNPDELAVLRAQNSLLSVSSTTQQSHALAANRADILGSTPGVVRDDGVDVDLFSVANNRRRELTDLYASDRDFATISRGDHDNLAKVVDASRVLASDVRESKATVTFRDLARSVLTADEVRREGLGIEDIRKVSVLGLGDAVSFGAEENIERSILSFKKEFRGGLTPDELIREKELSEKYNEGVVAPDSTLFSLLSMAPFLLEGFRDPESRELVRGGENILAGGLVTGIAGAVAGAPTGPGVAATAPIGFGTGAGAVVVSQATINIMHIETGAAFLELSNFKDSEGNHLDPDLVRLLSQVVGVVNGGAELVQIGAFAKVTGLSKLGKRGLLVQLKKIVKDPAVAANLTTLAKRHAALGFGEGTVEAFQEITNVVAINIAEAESAGPDNRFRKDPPLVTRENLARIGEAFKIGTLASLTLQSPSASIQTVKTLSDEARVTSTVSKIRNLSKAVSDTNTHQLRPQEVEKLIAKAGADLPVFVTLEDAQILFQELGDAVEKVGIDETSISKAAELGQAIELSAAKLSTLLSGANLDKVLEVVRESPEGASPKEIAAADAEGAVSEIQNVASRTKEEDKLLKTELKRVRDEALSIGVSKQQADANIDLLAGFADRMAFEGRQSAAEVVKQVRIVGPGTQVVVAEQQAVVGDVETFGSKSRNPDIRAEAAKLSKPDTSKGVLISTSDGYAIKVFEKADASTIPHELSHIFFLEVESLVESGGASKELVGAMAGIKEWMGLSISDEITVDQYEQFADGFTKWLAEGKAPNAKMEKAFSRFRKWLTSLYKRIRNKAKLTDDVREAMGRFVSVEAEVEVGRVDVNAFALTKEEMKSLGMTRKDADKAQALVATSVSSAATDLVKSRGRDRTNRRKVFRRKATAIIERSRVHVLMRDLVANGPLDLEQVKSQNGQDVATAIRKKNGKFIKTGGRDIDSLARRSGYADSNQMVRDILESETPSRAIEKLVQNREAKFDAIYSGKESVALSTEWSDYLGSIGKFISQTAKKTEPRSIRAAIVAVARKNINELPLKEATRTDRFISNAQRLVREQNAAIVRQDFDTALTKNRQARVTLEMARESVSVRSLRDKVTRTLKKSASAPAGKIDQAYHDAIKELGHRSGVLREGAFEPLGELQPLSTLVQVEGGSELLLGGPTFSVPLVVGNAAIPLTDMTPDQAIELRDLVKYLDGRGREEVGTLRFLDGREIGEVVSDLLAPLEGFSGREEFNSDSSVGKVLRFINKFAIDHTSFTFLMGKADNYVSAGPKGTPGLHKTLIQRPLREALLKRREAQKEFKRKLVNEPLVELRDEDGNVTDTVSIDRYMSDRIKDKVDVETSVPVFPLLREKGEFKWTYERVFSLLLNRGTQRNVEALADGYDTSVAEIDRILADTLNDNDFAAAQAIWDLMDESYPALNKVHNKLYHFSMKKRASKAFVSRTGRRYEGGYFPIAFDAELNAKSGKEKEAIESKLRHAGVYQNPVSMESFYKETKKTSGGRPVRLDSFNVFGTHMKSVIDAIELDETLVAINRVFLNEAYRSEIIRVYGADTYNAFRKNLNLIKNRDFTDDGLARAMDYTRSATNVYLLSQLSTASKQFYSYANFAGEFGLAPALLGMKSMALHPIRSVAFARESSLFMRDRANNIEADITQGPLKALGVNSLSKFGITKKVADSLGLALLRFSDMITTTMAWTGAYQTELKRNGGDAQSAIAFAEEAVAETQPSNLEVDLAPIQLNRKGLTRAFTYFTTFMFLGGGVLSRRGRFLTGAFRAGQISFSAYVTQMMIEFMLPPIMMNMMMSYMRGDDIEIDEVLGDVLFYQLSGVFILRDVAHTARKVFESRSDAPISRNEKAIISSPATLPLVMVYDVTDGVVKALAALGDDSINSETKEKRSEEALWNLARLASYGTKIPAAQYAKNFVRGYEQIESDDGFHRQVLRVLFPSHKDKDSN